MVKRNLMFALLSLCLSAALACGRTENGAAPSDSPPQPVSVSEQPERDGDSSVTPDVQQEGGEREGPACRVELINGRSYFMPSVQLRSYFGMSQYWYSTDTDYYHYSDKRLRIVQGWLWSDLPFDDIRRLTRIDGDKLADKTFPTIYGGGFKISQYDPLFRLDLRSGTTTYANIYGEIQGKKQIGGLSGDFEIPTSEIATAEFVGENSEVAASFTDIKGARYEGIIDLALDARYDDYDRLDYLVEGSLRLVTGIELGKNFLGKNILEKGGVTIEVSRDALRRPLRLTRIGENLFAVTGLAEKDTVLGELGWVDTSDEVYRSSLWRFFGRADLDGTPSTLALAPEWIKQIVLGRNIAGEVVATVFVEPEEGKGVVRVDGVQPIEYWYNYGSPYNNSEESNAFTVKIERSTFPIDIRNLSILEFVRKGDEGLSFAITLQSGERHIGELAQEEGRPYAFVGKLDKGGLYGFPAEACLLLEYIRRAECRQKS